MSGKEKGGDKSMAALRTTPNTGAGKDARGFGPKPLEKKRERERWGKRSGGFI